MRVIAGTARGVRLESPSGTGVRPTLDRVRESLFNILGEFVLDATVLDLFAGTGAVGIEALSRGATQSVFVDQSAGHLALVQRNLAKTKLSAHGKTLRLSIPDRLASIGGAFEIIYADPPHDFCDYQKLIESIDSAGLLAKSGRFILESPSSATFDAPIAGLTLSDSRTYGNTRLTIFT